MPTYEYRCPEGHEFERFQKMTDPPRARCPVCGRNAVRQISGGAGLIFKGSGFYITDYGKDGKGPRQDKESEAKPEAAGQAAESASPPQADKPESPAKEAQGDKSARPDKSEKKSAKKKASS
jgi:putative FmdB family regulatory protein